MLLAYVYVLVLDHHKAEDVLQETAVTLIRRAHEFGEVKNFWLLAKEISRRHALALLRKEANAPRSLSERAIMAIDDGFDHIQKHNIWDRDALFKCIRKLPKIWRRMIRLRYWMQMSVDQIARELSRSANTISVTLNRARIRLADCMIRCSRLGESA